MAQWVKELVLSLQQLRVVLISGLGTSTCFGLRQTKKKRRKKKELRLKMRRMLRQAPSKEPWSHRHS